MQTKSKGTRTTLEIQGDFHRQDDNLKKDPSNKETNTMASTSADVPMEDATAAPASVSRNCVFVEGAKD